MRVADTNNDTANTALMRNIRSHDDTGAASTVSANRNNKLSKTDHDTGLQRAGISSFDFSEQTHIWFSTRFKLVRYSIFDIRKSTIVLSEFERLWTFFL